MDDDIFQRSFSELKADVARRFADAGYAATDDEVELVITEWKRSIAHDFIMGSGSNVATGILEIEE